MMNIEVLYLEDDPDVAAAIELQLQADGLDVRLKNATDNASYKRLLSQQSFDLVLIDYVVPDIDGLEALKYARSTMPMTPVIMISGKVDEEVLVEALRHGASDYVTKGRLQRLAPAIQRAIEESHTHTEYQKTVRALQISEQRLADIAENIPGAIYEFVMRPDGSTALPFVSRQFQEMTNILADEVRDDASIAFSRIFPADLPDVMQSIETSARDLTQWVHDFRFMKSEGKLMWLHGTSMPKQDSDGAIHWCGVFEDITALQAAREIRDQFFRLTNDLIFITDLEGRILKCGGTYQDRLGYSQTKMQETNLLDYVHSDDHQQMADALRQTVSGESALNNFENRFITSRGDTIWLSWNVVLTEEDTRIFATAHDITQQKIYENELEQRVQQRTQELERSKKMAEEANMAKTTFLSKMSHELRTPLNSILGFAQLMQLGIDIPEKYKDDIEQIIDSGKYLLSLVEDLLDLSLIEGERLEFRFEYVNLDRVLVETVNVMQPVARNKGIQLKFLQSTDQEVYIKADPVRIRQVMLNLISNAIKYNREHGSVDVYYEIKADHVLISVNDTGIGITKEDMGSLFMPFSRLNLDKHNEAGTGIGLSITKYLVEQMFGNISVESDTGKGSRFIIDFKIVKEMDAIDDKKGGVSARQTGPGFISKILYIEDSPSHIEFMHRVFDDMFVETQLLTANTPRLGLELARAHMPDIILLDICLPGISGFDLMMRIKEDKRLSQIPVVAISANAHPAQIEEGLRIGFRRYLTKPVDVIELRKVVLELLQDKVLI